MSVSVPGWMAFQNRPFCAVTKSAKGRCWRKNWFVLLCKFCDCSHQINAALFVFSDQIQRCAFQIFIDSLQASSSDCEARESKKTQW